MLMICCGTGNGYSTPRQLLSANSAAVAWAGLNAGHQFAPFGMCLMLLAEVAEGTKLVDFCLEHRLMQLNTFFQVLTQKLLKDCKFSVLEGLYRMSPISTVMPIQRPDLSST